jgi:hypothetical protein
MASALCTLLLTASLSSLPSTWDEGKLPEGDNAFTVHRGEVRLALFGRSAVGLTDRLELSTNLLFPTPEFLLPNLHLKYRFLENDTVAAAIEGGGMATLLPIPVAGALPLPGAIVGVAAIGAATGAVQHLEGHLTFHAQKLSATLTGGGYVAEGALLAAGVGGIVGGVGVAAIPIAAGMGSVEYGATFGGEMAVAFDAHNAVMLQGYGFTLQKPLPGNDNIQALTMESLSYLHRWDVFTLTLGAYSIVDLPHAQMITNSKLPAAPFFNLAWTFGGASRR